MMKNLILFAVFTISSGLMLANIASGFPDLRVEEVSLHPGCPKNDQGLATLLPHESDCTSYYMCQSGVGILKTCPHDLHFNPKKKVCDFPERAGCTTAEEEEEEEPFLSGGLPHSDCPSKDPKNPVIFPHESDCSKFYTCRSGLAYERICPDGLHFNSKLRVCDYPENAKCTLRFPKQGNDKVPKCPKINKSVATLLPHETDCTLYYICESGEPILRYCPDDLHFNPRQSVCDFPGRAGCEKGELHVQLAEPQETGSPSPFCPLINGVYPVFFPHPTNCSIYYMCGNGLAYEFSCPRGLHFNVRKKVCDYPQNANCRN